MKKPPACLVSSLIAATLLLPVTAAWAQETPKWSPYAEVEAKPGSKRNLGEADFFLPLMQDGRTLVFGNARLRLAEHGDREGNLGVGVRRMLEGGWNLGGYGYVDRRRSENGNTFNQTTVGAELLGRDWDWRGNVYVPVGNRARSLGSSGGSSSASIVGTTIQVNTAGTTTREERALKGFDAEVGWRVPAWDAEANRQLRLYVGGYRFSDDAIRVSGPRVRAELTLYDLPAIKGAQLVLGAQYQDDKARGGQGFVSARLRIPFGGETKTGRGMNYQERRMAAPVVRDVDIVTQSRVAASTPGMTETATATANGQTITVLSSGTTTGAALPGAVVAAGANSTVVLTGTYTTTATTTTQAGQTLMGAGSLTVRTPSGQTAVLAAPGATISGDIGGNAATVTMGVGSTLTGMTVTNFNTTNGTAVGVRAATNSVIAGNTISTSTANLAVVSEGVLIFGGGTNFTIRDNIITATGNNVQNIVGINASPGGFGTVLISGNTITLTGTGLSKEGIGIAGGVPGGTIATIIGNTISVTGGTGVDHMVRAINSAVTAGSNGNVHAAGVCSFLAGTSGSVGFTDGTPCP